ncbi:MAG TPA: M14 family metallopeptidase, partial [Phycisphaerae bacterium]|nr:M14 family metallopeptidase [Phycisphaerae bacterium]
MKRRTAVHSALMAILAAFNFSPAPSVAQPTNATPQPPPTTSPADWLTKTEQTDFRETPRYDETVAYCRRLAEGSPFISCQSFGKSPEGRELLLVVASNDRAFTPEAARATGKLIVLVQNCIHAGECAGKDASLMLLRDMAVTKTRPELLDNVIILVMPIFNVDGHERFGTYSRINQNGPAEMGWRTTARNFNLNRDYVKADAVEMRAWLALWNAWQPDLFIDHHETDGIDWQYDFLYAIDQHAAVAPQVVEWTKAHLGARLFDQIEKDGHPCGPYMDLVDGTDPAKGVRSGWFSPRLSNGYVVLRNRPGILVEGHMLKPYRTQVLSHYDLMLRVLEELNREPRSLRAAVTAADEATIKMGSTYDPAFKLP